MDFHGTIEVLKDLYLRGQLQGDQYFQALFRVAAEWAEIGEKQEARDLISQVTLEYVIDVLPGQMERDEEFRKHVCDLAAALATDLRSDSGDVDLEITLLRGPTGRA